MVSNSRHRFPSGHTQSQIIRLLHKEENQKLRFKDIQSAIGVSKPVLSKHLDKLEERKDIISIKDGREKFYMLSKNIYKILERRIDILASNYNLFTNNELAFLPLYYEGKPINPDAIEKLYANVGNKINAVLIFSVLKSLETGEKWTDAIDVDKFITPIIQWFISSIYGTKIPYETYDRLESFDFKEIKKIANKAHKNGIKSDLKPFYESLCKMYPAEFDILDFSFKKPHANWQEHQQNTSPEAIKTAKMVKKISKKLKKLNSLKVKTGNDK